MLKKIFLMIVMMVAFWQSLLGNDYYFYGQWKLNGSGYGAGGYIDKNGKLGEPGKEYIFFTYGNTGYIYRVDTEGDPNRHPNNPNATGEIAKRTFTFISSHPINNCGGHRSAFHIDDSGIYHGGSCGVKRWDFDWSNEEKIVSTGISGQTFTRNSRTGDFWEGKSGRQLYKWDGNQWIYQLTYPNLGGSHHDGMTIANDILFVSDMTSDKIATYKLDKQGNVVNPDAPDHIYSYNASPVVEGMGFGPNNHIWITSGSVVYEIGGGKLQEQLSSCSQVLMGDEKWQMLSSVCDVKNATAFTDAVLMKKVGENLTVYSSDAEVRAYYENLGYETNTTFDLKRGEGFWFRSKTDGIRHVLVGVEESIRLDFHADKTEFVGMPGYHSINLDEIFGDKPVKEIRFWDNNSSIWRKWQPNHVDSNMTEIPGVNGFYVCVKDGFSLEMSNLSPIAKIDGDGNITVGETLSLSAFGSFDRDGVIVSYEWKEGNQTLSLQESLIIDDLALGWHKIILTVTDDDGAIGHDEAIIRVSKINEPPTVVIGDDRDILLGESLTLHADTSDTDGYILIHEWKLDGTLIAQTPSIELNNLTLGDHNITVTVIDNDLGKASDSITVSVHAKPDATPPVITVLGSDPLIVLKNTIFNDPGAIAVDDRDGNVSVEKNGTVDTAMVGRYTIYYSAEDMAGNLAQASREVIVQEPSANIPPQVDAGNDSVVTEDTNVTLNAIATDSDGTIVSYLWKYNGVVVSQGSGITISGLDVGDHVYTVVVEDNDGAIASDSIKITVIPKQAPDTTPPVITILGDNPYILLKGGSYTDAGATAWDDRDGNVSVGISYTIDPSISGTYRVRYTAQDRAGNQASAERLVLVKDNNTTTSPDTTPPVITLIGDNPMNVMLNSTFNDPGVIVVDDRDGQIGYSIRHNINTARLGAYIVIYSAEDSAGNSVEANRTVFVKDPAGNHPPVANAGNDIVTSMNTEVLLNAANSYDEDGYIIEYEWSEEGKTLSNDTSISLRYDAYGIHKIILTITDNDGESAADSVLIRIIDPSDTIPPTAYITTPEENTKVTLQTPIMGTASDDNLDYYVVEISPVGKETYTQIARGESSVTDDVLGTIDATTLRNGIYDIKLTVVDKNGARSEAYTKVIIDGRAKIGDFSFTVTDFDIKVGGLPVQVNRTYSTLQRFEKLDFTYAWSVDYQNVKIEESVKPGLEWRVEPMYLLGLPFGNCFKPKKQHIVNISLPDGTTESFEYKFARECDHGYNPGTFWDAPILKPLNGTEATLKALDTSTVMVTADGRLISGYDVEPYDPDEYQLTLSNGMVYILNENFGIKKVIDPRGETLTYSRDGIVSSRGESLSFERDSQNRITKITDLAGKSVIYHYDTNNDLDYVIDQMGQKTRYTYQEGHLLEEYIDPSGLKVAKNIYDEHGRLIKTIDADGNVVEFTHDIEGNEEVVKDRLGRISVYVYDDEGNVLSQTNPMGETTLRTYDDKGRELTVTDPLGHTTTNTYDDKGNLLSTVDALGHAETTSYNDKGSPTKIADKNGNAMTIVYDSYNAPTSMTTANGATTKYAYDNFNNKISVTNEYNETTRYRYDEYGNLVERFSKGNLLKETRPEGTVIEHTYDESNNMLTTKTTYPDGTVTNTSNTYDAFNRLTSATDERGNTTSYEYDARGNKVAVTDIYGLTTRYAYNNHNKLVKTTYPDGTIESKTYDAMDNLLSETDKEGHTTSYEYDAADRLVKTTYPDGSTTTNTYDAAGRLTSTTDQNGHTTTYTYDAVGNKLSQTDALGNETRYTYDAQGNLLSVTDALNQTTRYEYNALNQRVKTIYPDGSTVVEAKNISGLPSSKTDEAGRTTQYGYDTARTIPLLNSVSLPNGAVTAYSYDSQGKKTAQTDALGHTTQWRYEPTGELSEEILPDGSRQTHTYSPKGLEVQQTDYAGKSQTFVYNAYKQLVRIEYSDGSTVTYSYTPAGRLKTITDSQGTITNTYDSRGRLKTRTTPNGDTITYSYDGVGNITRIETPTQTIEKTYDALNRLKTVTDSQGTTSYEYDAIGRQTKVTYPNGVSTSYEYDSRNRVTSITHTNANGETLLGFSYTYDAVGNRLSEIRNDGRTVSYEYNEVNQLTKATVTNDPNGNNTTTTYSYDKVGNLISKTVEGIEHTYVYDANDRLIEKDGVTLTYDANGNLIDDGTNTYEWDDKNRLVKVTTPTDVVEYLYDGEDNRIAKVTSGGTTTYLIDSNTPYAQVITESKENGTEIHYTYGNDLINDGTHYFLTDALGSTRGLVDAAETLTDSYDYHPYGELFSHDGNATSSFLFTGEQFDAETNNYYLRARYYSPTLTRFLSRDTYDGKTSDPFSQNHYLYAGGNPVIYVDPSGEFSVSSLSMSMAISGIINVGIGYGSGTIHSLGGAAESFIIGALEGGAFYGIIGVAGKFARFVNVDKLKPYIYKVRSNFIKKVPLKPGVVPGTNIPLEYVISTKMGPVIIHSSVGKNGVQAAMKHIKEMLVKGGMAGKTNLAEALAMKEVEEAVQKGIVEGIVNAGKTVIKNGKPQQIPTYVYTEHAKIEIAIVWDSKYSMYKLIHFRIIN